MSKYFFSASGVILMIGAIAFSTQQLNLGIDFESGTRITAALAEDASAEEVRTALNDAGIDGIDSAEIQSVENEDFGANVIQMQAKIPPDQAPAVQGALSDAFGLEGDDQGFQNESVGPTFGQQVAENAVKALIMSLLVISVYVAIRFEAKYAVPVLIALFHDILITGGIYALTGLEVTSATVAAFLTILGYSMYDTIIVFDRIRENVPRMPRAAFSQIVNRSMAEVLTRSLITGLSTVFLVGMILDLRRRDPARLRLRDDGRDRLRYVLVDLHRRARPDRVEGARAHVSRPPPPDRGDDGLRAGLPRGQRRRPRGGSWRAGRRARAES